MSMRQQKAVICGAGIAGLTLALRLDQLGWNVTVLERSDRPRDQGYMLDFFGPGYDTAEAIGVLPRLREIAYDIDEATYLDEHGRRRGGVDYTRFAQALQGRLLSILRPDLEEALREQLPGTVDLRFGTSLTGIDNLPERVRITLTDGSSLDADLLVGADGVHSTVRRLEFGPEDRYLRYLNMHTAAFTFDDPEVYAEVRGRFCLTDSVGRQVGLYGLRDGRVATFLVHRTPDPALPADSRAAIRSEYASLGWVVPRVLAACPPAGQIYYDQVAQIELPEWSTGRVTLIGDACQAVSLLAGQGASLAMAGAYVLAEQLERADTVAAALLRYEAAWRPLVADRQRVGRSGAEWFLPRSRLRLRLRRAAMRLARLPGLDRRIPAAVVGKPTAIVRELADTTAGRSA